MSKCPYTWFKNLFASNSPSGFANHLRVSVTREADTVVDVALPAHSARWLIDLIPEDVIAKIRSEGIPIEAIEEDLKSRPTLFPQKIFELIEPQRSVHVWLE